jgi:hypothetical protein
VGINNRSALQESRVTQSHGDIHSPPVTFFPFRDAGNPTGTLLGIPTCSRFEPRDASCPFQMHALIVASAFRTEFSKLPEMSLDCQKFGPFPQWKNSFSKMRETDFFGRVAQN